MKINTVANKKIRKKILKCWDTTSIKILNKKANKTKKKIIYKLVPKEIKPQSLSQEQVQIIAQVNPFFKVIDRHYGSFKTKILGNYSKAFNSLPLKELKPLGRNKTGARRKILTKPSYTALFYSNGTIEIKPAKKKGLNPDKLQDDFFRKAKKCCSLLESMGLALAPLKMNRSPKYGYKDKTASIVKQECSTENRKMDKTPDPSSIDNFGAAACKRDLRLSGEQNFELAKARLENPEIMQSIEQRMGFIIDTNAEFAKNLKLHLEVLQEMKKSLKAMRPKRHRFPTSFKKSVTVGGVS